MLVEWWFYEFLADDEIKENEQEEGAVEDHLADNRSEIDSDCPEITNCGGKLISCLIIAAGHMLYYKIVVVRFVFHLSSFRIAGLRSTWPYTGKVWNNNSRYYGLLYQKTGYASHKIWTAPGESLIYLTWHHVKISNCKKISIKYIPFSVFKIQPISSRAHSDSSWSLWWKCEQRWAVARYVLQVNWKTMSVWDLLIF